MVLTIGERQYDLLLQLHPQNNPKSPALSVDDVTGDVRDLIQETYIGGILAEQLPPDPAIAIRADFRPLWLGREPFVEGLEIKLTVGKRAVCRRTYRNGRWARRAEVRAKQLRDQGQLGQQDLAFRMLVAVRANGHSPRLDPPVLEIPPIADLTWEELGIRRLGTGALRPERPILLNSRMEADIRARTREAGQCETGGACLGRFARLPEPLPGARTRIVTVLAASVCDARHEGTTSRWTISPDALAEAAQLAEIRGERVMTCWHSHGFCDKDCDKRAECPLVSPAYFSLDDYGVAETLFPSKATVMPICGKDPQQTDPVLVIHGWEDGMKPLPWRLYED